ncbi:MAG: 2-amino-4-hydroxy-6-hydroxymethyldihydropteridine diphosphokinase [Desulfurivibrio sp.]|nr:2-amino-4-hydroxy-6-hydroxymethyldihydropteridine diphosphokinase [Desulfurivibrio sp.]
MSGVQAFIGLGANLGAGPANLLAAWQRLAARPGVESGRLSRPWGSAPVGISSEQWFTNAVGELHTTLEAEALLAVLLAIEQELGRDRARQGEDRPIDLDLLLYGEQLIDLPHCRVPHPAMAQRRFVLEPLRELAPRLIHPGSGRSIEELAAAARQTGQQLKPLAW